MWVRVAGVDVDKPNHGGGQTASRLTAHASRPILSPGVPQYFVPIRSPQPDGSTLVYQPMLLGSAQVRFVETKQRVDCVHAVTFLAPITDGVIAVDWHHAIEATLALTDLEPSPAEGSKF